MSTTYINSKVSLISKSMIRYEGTLFSINAEEATITLSNVKSFGTEGRKADKFIPPRDAIFEYIIFKATDIKDLIVDEPLVNEFNDPAILQAHTSLSTTTNNSTNENKSLSLNAINAQANVFSSNQPANPSSVQSAGQTERFGFRSRISTPSSSQPRSPVSEISSQRQKTDKQLGQKIRQNNFNNFVKNNRRRDNQQNYNNNQRYDGWKNRPFTNNRNNMMGNNRRQVNYYQNNKYQNDNYNNHNNRSGQNYHRNNDSRDYRYTDSSNLDAIKRARLNQNNNDGDRRFDINIKKEFDFEKANETFQQMVNKLCKLNVSCNGDKGEKTSLEEGKEDGKNTILNKEDDKNFYDKKKSFFDNISCEAIEKSKGKKNRFDWNKERKLNAETFGLQISYRRNDINQNFRSRNGYNNRNRKFSNGNNHQARTFSS